MDKFGIFKLLNSFCDFYNKNKGENKSDFNSKNTSEQDPSLKGIENFFNSAKNIFGHNGESNSSSFNPKTDSINNKTDSFGDKNDNHIIKKAPKVSLSNPLLNTIRSHDEIVKRVNSLNEKNKKQGK